MTRKRITMKSKEGKTFDEGFESFITEHCVIPNLRESTIKHYREIIKYSFYKFYDKDSLLADLEQSTIEDYTFYLRKSGIRESTVNIQLKALKTIISFFKNKEWVDNSVNVKLIKADIEPIEAYTDEEIKKLLVKPNLKKIQSNISEKNGLKKYFCIANNGRNC
jgi:integrase/recombinase XerD